VFSVTNFVTDYSREDEFVGSWDEEKRRLSCCGYGVHRRGPDTLVQTHAAHSGVLGNDLKGGMTNEVDLFGLTSFPKWLQGPNHQYTHLAHCEIVAEASRGKPFYQVELQAGIILSRHFFNVFG